MTLPSIVRRAIADSTFPKRRVVQPGSASVSVVVRLNVDPARIKKIGGREIQLNLTDRELTCLQPIRITLFSKKDTRRKVRLIINRRRVYLLSVTETGIIVFTYRKF